MKGYDKKKRKKELLITVLINNHYHYISWLTYVQNAINKFIDIFNQMTVCYYLFITSN